MEPTPVRVYGDMKRQCRCPPRRIEKYGSAHDRILNVSRTPADLCGNSEMRAADILEAIQYRALNRKLFS